MNLSERAMLASLTIRRWQATLTDQKITREVAQTHSVAVSRAGHYRKHAIDVNAPSFRAVAEAASDIRHRHYHWTLPWGQDGARILTTANFEKYSADMRKLRAAFEKAVAAFITDYPRLCESARRELNGLYDPKDYPSNIAARFGIDVSIMPLPDSADFRARLSEGDVDDIKASIEAELKKTTALAMRDPYERLYGHISRMVERLSDPKGTFRDSLVSGLAELCSILPGLNLTADPLLEDLRKRAEQLIAGIDAQTLRESPTVRASVAKQAADIQDLMAGFMSPGGES